MRYVIQDDIKYHSSLLQKEGGFLSPRSSHYYYNYKRNNITIRVEMKKKNIQRCAGCYAILCFVRSSFVPATPFFFSRVE